MDTINYSASVRIGFILDVLGITLHYGPYIPTGLI